MSGLPPSCGFRLRTTSGHAAWSGKETFPPQISCISKVSHFVPAKEGSFHLRTHQKMKAEENKVKDAYDENPVGLIVSNKDPMDSFRQTHSHFATAEPPLITTLP